MFKVINQTDEKVKEVKIIKKVLKHAIKKEKLKNVEFNVIIVDNSYIKELNCKYRNINKETDVISFALEDYKDIDYGYRLLGDIYISLDKAKEQANEFNHSLKRELSFLSIHGLLHLLGYDHMNQEDEMVMFAKQDELLQDLNIIK